MAEPDLEQAAARPDRWTFRAKLFVQRFWQPTSACLSCMPGSLANVASAAHWEIALRTGLYTGLLILLLSYTRFATVFRNRYGNAVVVGGLTALGDAYSHHGLDGSSAIEPIVTGCVAGVFALVSSYLFEDRARRLRSVWRRVVGR